MKPAIRNSLASSVILLAVLIVAWQGEPWTAAVISSLFIFVLFPRWRRSIYRIIIRLTKSRKHDSCDHKHHGGL